MTRHLSSPLVELKPFYEVVVVGSGYGGAISASRLARAGREVCVLERGRELLPGQYPNNPASLKAETQVDTPKWHTGRSTALYDLRLNSEIGALVGCGLGGSSLVDAGVCMRPSHEVFQERIWPKDLPNDPLLEEGFRRAESMLRPTPYPKEPKLLKRQALQRSGTAFGEKVFSEPKIAVNFEPSGPNHAGIPQEPCNNCGDCLTGCNYNAKNTLLTNYLPDAKAHGAKLFCQVQVRRIAKRQDRWRIYFHLNELGRESLSEEELFLDAKLLILSAGTLGTTEILLRSRASGLLLSERIGEHFSGNGEVLAFSYNSDYHVNGVGFGEHPPKGRAPVGPCTTALIDLREGRPAEKQLVIEEGAIPGALASFLPEELGAISRFLGQDTDSGMLDALKESVRRAESFLLGPYHGAVRNTLTYHVMGHDGASGRVFIDPKTDRLRIAWRDLEKKLVFDEISKTLLQATSKIGGTYVPDPLSSKVLGQRLLTLHPLGGCVMADHVEEGAVNHKGQVFVGGTAAEVYPDFYVLDGSTLPTSLGVSPIFTISALAERACQLLCQDKGWALDVEHPTPPLAESQPRPMVSFTETLKGTFAMPQGDSRDEKSYRVAEALGEITGKTFSCTITSMSEDVEALLQDNSLPLSFLGTAKIPALSPKVMSITEGKLVLFVPDPNNDRARKVVYQTHLTDEDGKRFYLEGERRIIEESGPDIWRDCTTLFIDLWRGEDKAGEYVGRGILRTSIDDYLRQLGTIQVSHVKDKSQQEVLAAKFGRLFACALYDVYLKRAHPNH